MSEPLFIWLPDDLSGPWDYVQSGLAARAYSGAEKTALSASGGAVIAVLPGQSVRRFVEYLPKMRERELVNAAQFAIEDRLGTGLKGQHIVVSNPAADGGVKITVITTAAMDAALSALSHHNLSPNFVYADFDMISDAAARYGSRIIVNDPQAMSFDADWDDGTHSGALALSIADITAPPPQAVNMRVGQYSAKTSASLAKLRWRPIAALFAACCAAGLMLLAGQTRAMQSQAGALRTEAATLYTAATGQPAPANTALTAMRDMASGGAQQAEFLMLCDILFSIAREADGVIVDGLRYEDGSGQLSLQFIYPDFDSGLELERLAQARSAVLLARGVREQGGVLRGDAALSLSGGAP